jgi:hypothetical protein
MRNGDGTALYAVNPDARLSSSFQRTDDGRTDGCDTCGIRKYELSANTPIILLIYGAISR